MVFAAAAVFAAGVLGAAAQTPVPSPTTATSLDEVVARAQRYVVDYGSNLSLVIGVEHYRQSVTHVGVSAFGAAPGDRPWSRDTVAEFALIRIKDDWLGYRDVYQVDGTIVSDSHDRLRQLFEQTPASAVERGRAIADESARFNAGAVQRNFNVPTMALLFLHPSQAQRFRYERAGTDTIDKRRVWKVRFREIGTPTIVRSPEGKNMPVSGMFWIDPVGGEIVKTSLEVKDEVELDAGSAAMAESLGGAADAHGGTADRRVETFSRVTATYRIDARLELLVPAEMSEEHQGIAKNRATGRDRLVRIGCKATYSDFRRFETSGRLVIR
jgi:hypothetical protein